MRVLMLTQFFAPVVGGEERVVESLSAELARRGHDVALATQRAEGLPDSEVRDGIRVHRIGTLAGRARWLFDDPQRPHVPPAPDPEALLGLRRLLQQERPDVVHAHNWFVHSFVPLKRRSGAALVVSLHDFSLVCATKRLMYKATVPCSGPGPVRCLRCSATVYGAVKGVPTTLANWIASIPERRAVDMFLPVSRAVAARTGLLGSDLPFRVVPNFIPEPSPAGAAADADRHVDGLPAGDFVLYAGDLSLDKGIDVLLAAYAGLDDAPPLVLIGRPCILPTARPANVRVLGLRPHEAVLEAWRRCAVAVVPSVWDEPFGMVALEALAAGRPVIATDAGALPEIVGDGEAGVVVPRRDPLALREALRRVLDDAEVRERMGAAARRRADTFRASAVVPLVERAYEEARLR
jgi:glycosyltransferase involved in cell wall biosynthesis